VALSGSRGAGRCAATAWSASEAEAVFRRDLEMNPRNGRSLYGLLQCLKSQGNSVGAESVRREYEEAWKEGAAKLKVDML
jgi:Tfp pilus assembly protein PilF